MSGAAVIADGLGKRYQLGAAVGAYGRLSESIWNAFSPRARRSGATRSSKEHIWALRDVSFEIQSGDVVGIIGRNGAGKTTLLKILSRITSPTEGTARLSGRVGALLEVGTGFHPELTGRENVFLNGAILGMGRAEIGRKFDEIVAFSEVERFIDTPVKRYSSGMYVRLAFAVAAHLEPEILVVDEVLAVGDAKFQKKCLGKMQSAAGEGRTVLFVSHNMAAVNNLCTRGIVLQDGSISFAGTQSAAVHAYLRKLDETSSVISERVDRSGTGQMRVTSFRLRDAAGNPVDAVMAGQTFDVVLDYETSSGFVDQDVVAGLGFKSELDFPVSLHHSRLTRDPLNQLPARGSLVCRIERLPLAAGTYRIGFNLSSASSRECLDAISDAALMTVIEGDFYGSGEIPPISHGFLLLDARWTVENHDG